MLKLAIIPLNQAENIILLTTQTHIVAIHPKTAIIAQRKEAQKHGLTKILQPLPPNLRGKIEKTLHEMLKETPHQDTTHLDKNQ